MRSSYSWQQIPLKTTKLVVVKDWAFSNGHFLANGTTVLEWYKLIVCRFYLKAPRLMAPLVCQVKGPYTVLEKPAEGSSALWHYNKNLFCIAVPFYLKFISLFQLVFHIFLGPQEDGPVASATMASTLLLEVFQSNLSTTILHAG